MHKIKKIIALLLMGSVTYSAMAAWVSEWSGSGGNCDASVSFSYSNTIAAHLTKYSHPSQYQTLFWKESYQEADGTPGGGEIEDIYTKSWSKSVDYDSLGYNTVGHYLTTDDAFRTNCCGITHWGETDCWKY